jgi:aerobic-type carbon monoxide dehydrogenase small subunit (CoxS/CutS family)
VIDAKVFKFVEAHEFARRDFPQCGYNEHRLSREVTQLLLHRASLPAREIGEAAERVARAIVRCAGGAAKRLDKPTPSPCAAQ